jgi:hypothetical protein
MSSRFKTSFAAFRPFNSKFEFPERGIVTLVPPIGGIFFVSADDLRKLFLS